MHLGLGLWDKDPQRGRTSQTVVALCNFLRLIIELPLFADSL